MEQWICYAGANHLEPYGSFRVAVAVVTVESPLPEYSSFYACTDHLNMILDYADDHPEHEPVNLRWLSED
jgi:hypothetical protein